jgi:leader peptidase (prepilin peptidase)/N-methyltransferase
MFGQTISGRIADAPATDGVGDETDHSRGGGLVDRSGVCLSITLLGIGVLGVVTSVAAGEGAAGSFGAGLALVMLAIAAVDARRFLIPDPLNAAAVMLGVANAAVLGQGDVALLAETLLRTVVVAGAFLGLRFAYLRLRRRQGIGLGDVKLAAAAGAWLDWPVVPMAIEIAALSALAIYALRRFVLGHRLRPDARLPFGLFFAPAIWIGWLLQTLRLGVF